MKIDIIAGARPNFIKIDVEGAEYKVIKGALKILDFVNVIMIEIRKDNIELFKLLNSKSNLFVNNLLFSPILVTNFFFNKKFTDFF